jgi:DnaJ-class molecular chaperone
LFFDRILEVEHSCRDETIIRKAYLEKVKQYHPDSAFHDSQADQAKFNQVQQAYETLTVSCLSPQTLMNEKSPVAFFSRQL